MIFSRKAMIFECFSAFRRGQRNDSKAPIIAISPVQFGMIRAHLWVIFSNRCTWSSGNVCVTGS
ncbi:hypothetical protein D3C76_1747240 [compost metagenome]